MNKEIKNINILESATFGVFVPTFKKLADLLNCELAFFMLYTFWLDTLRCGVNLMLISIATISGASTERCSGRGANYASTKKQTLFLY